MMKIKRIYHEYTLWEDYKNGMYITEQQKNEIDLINEAGKILKNEKLFYKIGIEMVKKWKYSAEQNLSNKNRNRRAWIGQATSSYYAKVPEYLTKYAWRMLLPSDQIKANKVADKIIKNWEKEYEKKISTN